MSVADVTGNARLNGIPGRKVDVDPRLVSSAEQLEEVERLTDRLCLLCNQVKDEVRRTSEYTEQRINRLEAVNNVSMSFWRIMALQLSVLVGLKVVEGGWALVNWFQRRGREMQRNTSSRGKNGEASSQSGMRVREKRARVHPRQWSLSP